MGQANYKPNLREESLPQSKDSAQRNKTPSPGVYSRRSQDAIQHGWSLLGKKLLLSSHEVFVSQKKYRSACKARPRSPLHVHGLEIWIPYSDCIRNIAYYKATILIYKASRLDCLGGQLGLEHRQHHVVSFMAFL